MLQRAGPGSQLPLSARRGAVASTSGERAVRTVRFPAHATVVGAELQQVPGSFDTISNVVRHAVTVPVGSCGWHEKLPAGGHGPLACGHLRRRWMC